MALDSTISIKLPAVRCRVSSNLKKVLAVIAVDVRYFGDNVLDLQCISSLNLVEKKSFRRAFKKLPKSIPEALKKDITESKDMKIRHQLIKAKYF